MKLVVTGATGHIGSFLVRYLATQFAGAEIVMIDSMMTQRFASLFDMPRTARFRFVEGDVTSMDLSPIINGAYAVLHLAAITDAATSFERAEQVEANNYQSTVKVSQACAETGARLLAISSTGVYGTTKGLVTEDCTPEELNPQSPYAATKLKEEQLVGELCASRGLKAIVCRFGTIFGISKGMRFHTAVNKFCWQAAMGIPISVWKTAYNQKRPYLDLEDAARAVSFILHNELFDGRTYNILTLNAAVSEIVDTIRAFIPELNVEFIDSPIMNQLSYEVSSERFRNAGFNFSGDLKRGVGDTIALLKGANSF